jgi:hypothetical protein
MAASFQVTWIGKRLTKERDKFKGIYWKLEHILTQKCIHTSDANDTYNIKTGQWYRTVTCMEYENDLQGFTYCTALCFVDFESIPHPHLIPNIFMTGFILTSTQRLGFSTLLSTSGYLTILYMHVSFLLCVSQVSASPCYTSWSL